MAEHDHLIKGVGLSYKDEPEPKRGEHLSPGLSQWVVFNPEWPLGEGPYLTCCPGCEHCPKEA